MTNAQSTSSMPTRGELLSLAERLHPVFIAAEPFPHVVIDNLLPAETVQRAIEAFPRPGPGWQNFNDPHQKKYALRDEELMPDPIRSIIQQVNSQVFVEFFEELSGIGGLIPDPHLLGGGLHQIPRGGTLKVHVDFDQHRQLRADRRLNVILYLNQGWPDEYGGHLELWDADMTHAVERVAPVANRMVVFATSQTSFHGHPDVLAAPEGTFRRSLAWYFYTTPTEEREGRTHTLWGADQAEQSTGVQSTLRRMVPSRVKVATRSLRTPKAP